MVVADLFERLGLVIGTGRDVSIEFSVGTLVGQNRKVSFEFERELLETKPEGPATLTKINMKPVGEDGVELPPGHAKDQRDDVPTLQLDAEAATGATTTEETEGSADPAPDADDKAVTEEDTGKGEEVLRTPEAALTVSTKQELMTMEDEFAMTEEIFGSSLSPSMQEAYARHLKDMRQQIADEQKHLDTVRASRRVSACARSIPKQADRYGYACDVNYLFTPSPAFTYPFACFPRRYLNTVSK